MKQITLFILLIVILQSCQPEDSMTPQGLKGYLREYGTNNPIPNANIYLLHPIDNFSTAQYQSIAQAETNEHGYFEIPDTYHATLFYAVGDSHYIDLGVSNTNTIQASELVQNFYLYGKSWVTFSIQDTGQVTLIAGIQLYPFSSLSDQLYVLYDQHPWQTIPALGLAANRIAYQIDYADGTSGPITYLNFTNAAPQDTLAVPIFI
jgi:hypothetical protein